MTSPDGFDLVRALYDELREHRREMRSALTELMHRMDAQEARVRSLEQTRMYLRGVLSILAAIWSALLAWIAIAAHR